MKPLARRNCLWAWISSVLLGLASISAAQGSDNFIYTDNGTTVTITGYVGKPSAPVGPISIPATIYDPVTDSNDSVTSIGANAFLKCAELTSVTIPSGVTAIGNFAFSECRKLESVTIPSSVITIGNSAFSFCSALTGVNLPYGVTSLGTAAFGSCTALANVTIPSSVTSLGNSAFANCAALTNVEIPSSITGIGTSVFSGCSGLTSVAIPPSVTNIGANAFQYCKALTSVVIPPSVTTLKSKAFANCLGLTSMTIPHSVTTIETEVFLSCSSLTSIVVDEANLNFSSLNGVLFNKPQTTLLAFPPGLAGGYEIPGTMISIGAKAFVTCERLVGVTFPPGLLEIGSLAFSNCSGLRCVNFTGDAPNTFFSNPFQATSTDFTIYYLDAAALTFAEWPWTDYPNLVKMGENNTPSTAWLLSKGFPANTDIQSDPDGDGVRLLMARALNLDPHRNLSGEMPQPVIAGNQMSMSFYAAAAGINYVVETSTNLVDWSSEGVTRSGPDTQRTETVALSNPGRYMRLGVSLGVGN